MVNTWNMQAKAALAQFDQQPNITQLLYTIQDFRQASFDKPTAERREILNAGRPLVSRAEEVIKQNQGMGDMAGLLVETGIYLIECARKTVEESGVPPEMVDYYQGPYTRLGPKLASEDFIQGITIVTKGYIKGDEQGHDINQMNALRDFIIDQAKSLIIPIGDFDGQAKRLSLLCWITQSLGDDILFTQTISTLSALMRNAKQPQAAEGVVRKALEWSILDQSERKKLKTELASSLSEQGKFPEAEAILRELIGG